MAALIVVTLYEGKPYGLDEHMASVGALEHDGELTVLSVDDSADPVIGERIRAFTEAQGGIYAVPPPEVQPERGRVERVCALYNWVVDLCRGIPADHYLMLEDDVAVEPDFLTRMVPLLAGDGDAAVSGRIKCRRFTMTFGHTFCYRIEPADMLDDGGEPIYRLTGDPEHAEGVSAVGTNAFACLLVRKAVMDRIRLVNWYRGMTGFDFCFSLQLHEAGLRQFMAWDVETKHYYQTPGGEIRWI